VVNTMRFVEKTLTSLVCVCVCVYGYEQ
jgi:hypothetical protein